MKSEGFFNGTAVQEIIKRGVPANKLVVGKPVTPSDAMNSGWMNIDSLGEAISKGYDELKWYAGVMFWQYFSDPTGDGIKRAVGHLKEMCAQNRNCL